MPNRDFRLRRVLLALALAAASVTCEEAPHYKRAVCTLDGQVWFLGPAAGVAVRLHPLDESGARLAVVAETRTDEAGRYSFRGIRGLRDYVISAEIGGEPWSDPHAGTVGEYGAALVLWAPVEDLGLIEARRVQITPYTTLMVGVAEAWRAEGIEGTLKDARSAFAAWLTFDAVSTEIGDARAGLVGPGLHRLVVEGFAALAGRASDAAGVQPGAALSGEDLLGALLEDASGTTPAGFFDGLGPAGAVDIAAGPGRYLLSGSTLRDELAEAVRQRLGVEPWTLYSEGDVAPLLRSLRCSPSAIFERCDEVDGEDRTPPVIDPPTPAPETPLAGVVVIEVTASDPESGIRAMRLERLPADGPPIELSDRDDRPGVVNVVFDTTSLSGFQRVELRAVATSGSGAEGSRDFGYPLANLEVGEMVGHVVKGPAIAVEVRASALRPGGEEVELARAFADAAGSFRLRIHEWKGPVILRAVGTSEHPDGLGSAYLDEARGRALSWDLDQTLVTVVPDFDPESRNNRPVVITPLGDLAWARAKGLAASQGTAVLDAYEASLGLLAAHFGLAGADSVLHVRPAPADAPVVPPPTEAARYMLALACMSRQALDIAAELAPDAVDGFTALHLLAAYRQDVMGDGDLDGTDGLRGVVIEHGGRSRPLGDPLRADLAFACARWLGQPDNATGLDVLLLAQWLQTLALDESALFDPDVAAAPFDDAAPEVAVRVVATAAGGVADARIAGAVNVHIEAADRAGVLTIDGELEGGPPAALEVLQAVPEADRPAATPAAEWIARLDARLLPDGPAALVYVITDALGNAADGRQALVVDNSAPALEIEVSAGEDGARAGSHVAGTLEVEVRAVDEAGIEALEVRSSGAEGGLIGERDGASWRGRLLARSLADGPVTLEASATDAVGNAAEAALALHVDHAGPAAEIEVVATEEGRVLGDRVAGVIEVRVNAEDGAGGVLVEPAPGPLDTRPLVDGALPLRFTVTDALGNRAEVERVIEVDNSGPRLGLAVVPGLGGAVAGAAITGEVFIEPMAEDPSGVEEVRIEASAGGFGQEDGRMGVDAEILPDGPVSVRAVATDALGNSTEVLLALVVDNSAPVIRLTPWPDEINEIGGRWYTRAERLAVGASIADASPIVSAEFTYDLAPAVLDGDLLFVELGAAEQTRTLRGVAVDALGHRGEIERVVVVDRTAPVLEPIATAFVDERALDAGRVLEGAPTIAVSAGAEVRWTKWQDHWAAGDDNPIRVRWRASDAGEGPLQVRWKTSRSDWHELGPGGEYEAVLTAEASGFDPIGDPPAQGTPLDVIYEAEDAAGNITRGGVPGTLDIIPPPVEVLPAEGAADERWTPIEEVSLQGMALRDVWEGGEREGVLLKRFRLHNPHSIAVRASVEVPDRLVADVNLAFWMWGRTIDEMVRDRVDEAGGLLPIADDVDLVGFDIDVPCAIVHDVWGWGAYTNFWIPVAAQLELQDGAGGRQTARLVVRAGNGGRGCEELQPAVTGIFAAEAAVEVLPRVGEVDADGLVRLAPGETREVVVVSGRLDVQEVPEIGEVVRSRVLRDRVPWYNARALQSGEGAMWLMLPGPAVCARAFPDEADIASRCQAGYIWFGRRLQAVTDLRLWAGASDRATDWAISSRSVAGDLSVPAGAVQGCSPTRDRAEQLE